MTAAIPIVVVSADATSEGMALIEAEGVAAYLTKPIDVRRAPPGHRVGGREADRTMTTVPVRPPAAEISSEPKAALLADSTEVLSLFDLGGSILWANGSMGKVLGQAVSELIGVNLASLVHSDDQDRWARAREILATGATGADGGGELSGIEVRVRCRDGSWRILEWTLRADHDRGLLYGAGRDVTEQREADEALRRDEARLRAVLDNAPSSIFVKDRQGRYLTVNRQWSRITGIPEATAVGVTDAEIWPSNARSMAERERILLDGGGPQVSDELVHTRMGARHLRISRFPLCDESGFAYAIGAIATDITARTEAEKTLAHRERLLATVLRASPDIITLLKADATVEQVSGAHRAVLGTHYDDGADADLSARVHPEDRARVTAAFARMVTGRAVRIRLRFRVEHHQGHWVTLDTRGQAVTDESGAFAGAVIVARDMTARLASEQRLQEAREAAEGASRTKSEFLSRMSHELRTPLNSILGFAQLLQMDELPDEQAEAVDHILRAGRHLLDLIDEVLDIARIESGHLELHDDGCPRGRDRGRRRGADPDHGRDAGISVRVAIDDDAGGQLAVRADRQRLLQVLLNLLSNAVKYNRPGGRVDVSCHGSGPGRLRVVVTDTGRGIRAEDQSRVFTPFDRLGAEQSGIEGSGVGLAVSEQLVQRMGGQIGFGRSRRGQFLLHRTGCRPPGPAGGPSRRGPRRPGLDRGRGRAGPGGLLPGPAHGGRPGQPGTGRRGPLPSARGRTAGRPPWGPRDRSGPGTPARPDPGRPPSPRHPRDRRPRPAGRGPGHGRHTRGRGGERRRSPEVRQLLGRGVVGFLTKPFDVRALLSLVDAVRSARVG